MTTRSNSDLARVGPFLTRHSLGAFAVPGFATLEGNRQLYANWLFYHLCYVLEQVEAGHITRLIINVQPRSLKSLLASVFLPAWMLGRDPSIRFICVSHSEPLAGNFGGQTRAVMQSEWYRRTFPETQLTSARPGTLDLRTTRNGSRLAVGIGGAITGRGADIIIIDDPIKAQDALSAAARERVRDFADTSLWSRLNNRRTGAIILVMQRFHVDDLAGHLIRRGGWHVVSIPAIATEEADYQLSRDPTHRHHRMVGELLQPEREGQRELDEQRVALGRYNFAAQYQQEPIPAVGNIVRREDLRYYDHEPEQFDRIAISWDTASTLDERSDYSVGTVWGRLGDDFYLLEVIRRRLEFPALQRLMVEISRDYNADYFVVEDDGIGRAVVQNLRDQRLTNPRPRLNAPNTDKVARLLRHQPMIEDGRLHLPRTATWLADYEMELLSFPAGRHDDQVDSTTQALDYLARDAIRARPYVRRDPTSTDPIRHEPARRDPVRRTVVRR